MSAKKILCCCICNTCPDADDSSSITSSDTKNKHSLKSGNGIIDWIRLGNSGSDLTGVGGRVRLISPAELKKHNTKRDAWLAIRGRVYNITYYLPYHPGGAEELMRGAGRDATEIFDKIHPWINYDSLLVKCLVGTLRFDTEIFFDANDSFPESDLLISSQDSITTENHLAKYTTHTRKKSPHLLAEDSQRINGIELEDLPFPRNLGTLRVVKKEKYSRAVPPAIFFDWEQSLTKLIISIFTGPFSNPGAYLRITERIIIIEVTINSWVRTIRFVPEETVQKPIHTRMCYESGKIEIAAQKEENKMWKCCGGVTVGTATKLTSCLITDYKILTNEPVTHDTRLLTIAPLTGYQVFPLGHHVRLHQMIAGLEHIRSYTPVDGYWDQSTSARTAQLRLAIKRYDNGILSPLLTSLHFEDALKVSGPYGTFQLDKLKSTQTIYLLAAGTGITPMMGIIKFMLSKLNPRSERVHLLFFNKTEKDILFQEHLEVLTNKDKRFNVVHILSNANSTWTGRRGRVNIKNVSEIFSESPIICDEVSRFACICGPAEFSYTSLNILKSLGMDESFVHVFIGNVQHILP